MKVSSRWTRQTEDKNKVKGSNGVKTAVNRRPFASDLCFQLFFESPASSVQLLSPDTHTCCDTHTETHALKPKKQNETKAARADGGGVCRLTVWPRGEKIHGKQSEQPPERTSHESASKVQRGEVIWHANGQTDGVSPLHSALEINQGHLSLNLL